MKWHPIDVLYGVRSEARVCARHLTGWSKELAILTESGPERIRTSERCAASGRPWRVGRAAGHPCVRAAYGCLPAYAPGPALLHASPGHAATPRHASQSLGRCCSARLGMAPVDSARLDSTTCLLRAPDSGLRTRCGLNCSGCAGRGGGGARQGLSANHQDQERRPPRRTSRMSAGWGCWCLCRLVVLSCWKPTTRFFSQLKHSTVCSSLEYSRIL